MTPKSNEETEHVMEREANTSNTEAIEGIWRCNVAIILAIIFRWIDVMIIDGMR
jgi:hypothetical protein